MISAGKSKLLNVLYNINYLVCKPGIGTKFVNILRYNPEIKEPCFYHLKVEKQGDDYIFYKDSKLAEGAENIIEANEKINKELRTQNKTKYEDIFYMIEINEIPFIKDKDFLLTHDLCDIPGLSEYQDNNNNEKEKNNNEIKNNNKTEDKILKDKIIEDELKDEEKSNEKEEKNFEDEFNSTVNIENEQSYLTEIFKIIKNYIDGAIIILSIENYQKEENYIIIAKLQKVLQKAISNFLIILNKMDLSPNPSQDIENCKGLLIQHFQNFKTFRKNILFFIH